MLTERQLFLLKVLVNDYIRSAEPVGSRTIAKRDDIDYSPATIRNELADLEDLGFLEKPHSSAGRVPSEKGYRYYVDHLLSPELLSKHEMRNIKKAFQDQFYELEKVTQETANILSGFTQYTAIVLGPEVLETKLKHIQIVMLSSETAVLIIVTNTGHVENRTITLPKEIDARDIEKLVNILNDRLKDTPLYQLKAALDREIKDILRKSLSNYQRSMEILNDVLTYHPMDHNIYYSGKSKMLAQPEFKDIDKVLPLMNALDDRTIVYDLLRSTGENGIQIKIGHENAFSEIKDCSVITATYAFGEYMGTVAVIGPTRMTYPKVVTLMDVVTRSLTDLLTKRY